MARLESNSEPGDLIGFIMDLCSTKGEARSFIVELAQAVNNEDKSDNI